MRSAESDEILSEDLNPLLGETSKGVNHEKRWDGVFQAVQGCV